MPSAWRTGVRESWPLFLPTLAIGVSFGLVAVPVFGAAASLVMSAVVWSGTAQFAALSAVGGGAGAGLAMGTGLLANVRFVPMGFAIAPDLRTPWWRRAISGTLLVDASFAIAHRRSGGFDIGRLEGAALLQYVGWVVGTAVGVLGASALADPSRLGFDVIFPVFYLALLLPEVRSRRPILVALLSAAVTATLVPFAPAGVPVLAGACTALLGLRAETT